MPTLAANQAHVLAALAAASEELAGLDVAGRLPGVARSSVYAALAALQRDGFVEARWDHTASHPRRMMRITRAGQLALEAQRRALASAAAPVERRAPSGGTLAVSMEGTAQ